MGAGSRGGRVAPPARNGRPLLDEDGPVRVRCDVRGQIEASLLRGLEEPAEGALRLVEEAVVVVDEAGRIARLAPGELTERLMVCLQRGQRYRGRVSAAQGQVVVDVRPVGSP